MNSPPLNILLAEDERSVAFSISFALKLDGHKVEIVNDGEAALARLMVEPRASDLVITHLSAENRAAYDALGVDGMIPKPFDLHQLRAVIRQIADDRAAEAKRLLSLALPESDEPEERDTK
ncbi:MAG: hypothetical protein DME97_13415 [Verrucomicrobia bacterium]|nr:MAG: hypothetical protein DME97_13415 [Verrucomicrobiota bacterium]